MTKFFHLLAKVFWPIRYLVLTLVIGCGVALAYFVLFANITQQEQYMLPSLFGLLWSTLLWLLVASFYQPLPSSPPSGFIATIIWRIKRFISVIYGMLFIGLILGSIYFTFRISLI
ncbi:hypothetical protein [Thalassotalea sp. G2M2-11]|uniref:hypothetical protein n=1 Tax=Thalassotalea sp. G2M2-11 TaxID=2787627 RepID=UPI0019CF7A70|nr:hypothetical protein [Thalassotalea sp. G2M2-11]